MVFETLAAESKSGSAVVLGLRDGACSAPEQVVDRRHTHINGGIAIRHTDLRRAGGKHQVAVAILAFRHRAADELGQGHGESLCVLVIVFTG